MNRCIIIIITIIIIIFFTGLIIASTIKFMTSFISSSIPERFRQTGIKSRVGFNAYGK